MPFHRYISPETSGAMPGLFRCYEEDPFVPGAGRGRPGAHDRRSARHRPGSSGASGQFPAAARRSFFQNDALLDRFEPANDRQNQAGAPGDRRVEKLKKELGLTAAQVAKIKPIIERTAQQMKTLRSSVAVSPAQRKQQMRQILTASFQQIRPILTPQQLQKWKQIREEHRGQTQTAST